MTAENGPSVSIPLPIEYLKQLTPDRITSLTATLALKLTPLDERFDKTEDQIKEEQDFILKTAKADKDGKLDIEGHFAVDLLGTDYLWIIAHTGYEEAEALAVYKITRTAQLKTKDIDLPTDLDGHQIHQIMLNNPEYLKKFNKNNYISGDNAILRLLNDVINEDNKTSNPTDYGASSLIRATAQPAEVFPDLPPADAFTQASDTTPKEPVVQETDHLNPQPAATPTYGRVPAISIEEDIRRRNEKDAQKRTEMAALDLDVIGNETLLEDYEIRTLLDTDLIERFPESRPGIVVFQVSKDSDSSSEDICAISEDHKGLRIAIADGVTQSSLPRPWAAMLVQKWIDNPIFSPGNENWQQWLDKPRKAWGYWVTKQWAQRVGKYRSEHNMPALEPKKIDSSIRDALVKGASSTFAGVAIDKEARTIKTTAIGDSCIFVIDPLTKSFISIPVTKAGDFNDFPHQIASIEKQKDIQGHMGISLPFSQGYIVVLATDAMSKWIMTNLDSNFPETINRLKTLKPEAFADFVRGEYSNHQLEYDDQTMVVVDLDQILNLKNLEKTAEKDTTPEIELPSLEMGVYTDAAPPKKSSDNDYLSPQKGIAAVFDGRDIDSSVGDGVDAAKFAKEALSALSKREVRDLPMAAIFEKIETHLSDKKSQGEYVGQTSASFIRLKDFKHRIDVYRFETISAGDCAVWVFDSTGDNGKGRLRQISRIDSRSVSLANENGYALSREIEAQYYKERDVLTKVLAPQEPDHQERDFDSNTQTFHAKSGDIVILTTNGVHHNGGRLLIQDITRLGVRYGWSAERISQEIVLKAQIFSISGMPGATRDAATAATIKLP